METSKSVSKLWRESGKVLPFSVFVTQYNERNKNDFKNLISTEVKDVYQEFDVSQNLPVPNKTGPVQPGIVYTMQAPVENDSAEAIEQKAAAVATAADKNCYSTYGFYAFLGAAAGALAVLALKKYIK